MTSSFNQLLSIGDNYLYVTRVSSIAGNSVGYIARWDGTVDGVEAVGGGIDNGFTVCCLAGSAPNSVYIGGTFTAVGGGTAANRIAYYNGSTWDNLGGASVFTTTVNQLAYDSTNNLLYAASPSSSNTNRVSVYNGSTWTGIVTGFTINTSDYCKFALDTDGNLYVGHRFALRRWNRVAGTWTEISTYVGSIIHDIKYDAVNNRVWIVLATSSANNIRYYDIDGDTITIHSSYPGYPYAMAFDTNNDIYVSGNGTSGYVADVGKYNGSGYDAIFNLRDTAAVLDLIIDSSNTIFTWPNSSGFGIGVPPYTSSSDWDEWDATSTATISGPIESGGDGDAGGDPYISPLYGPSLLLPKDWGRVNLYNDVKNPVSNPNGTGYQLVGVCGFLPDKILERLNTMDFFYGTERPVTRFDEHIWQAPYFISFEVYYNNRHQLTLDGITGALTLHIDGADDRPADLRNWDLIKACHVSTSNDRGLISITQHRHYPKRQYKAFSLHLGEDKVIIAIDSYWDDINHLRLILGPCARCQGKTGELIRHNVNNCLERLSYNMEEC